MVSPQLQRSRRPTDHLQESNSTASLFLGGLRRDWMASAGKGTSGPREARLPRAMSHPKPSNPIPAAAPSKVSQECPGMDRPGPAELAFMSPVTPSANLQPPVSLQVQPTASNKPDPPTAALPSPVPSPASHPSPIQSPRSTIPSNGPPAAAVAAPSASDKPTAVGAVTAQLQRDETATPGQQAPNQPSPPSGQDQIARPNPSRAAETSDNSWPIATRTANPGPPPLQAITNGTRAQSLQTPRGPSQSPSRASTCPLHLEH